ncbi:MAG: hypothetical protein NZM18_05195, partial [Thermoflexales bacterium]|nr:hypothetical protein [Thermoflexales bacterium]
YVTSAALALSLTLALTLGNSRAQIEPQAAEATLTNMGTAFTYQGRLTNNGAPVNGNCDFQFSLWDAASGGTQIGSTQTHTGIGVSAGYFTVPNLNFGSGAFNGQARWLAIGVRCPAGSGSYTALSPRQALTPAPHALALPGLWTQQNNTSPNLIGGFHGNSVTANVIGATIGGGGSSGSSNRVTDAYGTVGGGQGNQAGNDDGDVMNTTHATVGGGYYNTASGYAATVGGGFQNSASDNYATVGGGYSNTASGYAATVGGGRGTTASGQATVGGGYYNTASGKAATVGGGYYNTAGGTDATVGGGAYNTASGYAATVGGGHHNTAAGDYSFVVGRRAKNTNNAHDGVFIFADSTDSDFTSTAPNQFLIRAGRGVGVNTNTTLTNTLTVNGQVVAGGAIASAPGGEPFISVGPYSGISMDDRAGGSHPRWVIFPQGGTLRFWNGADRVTINNAGKLTAAGGFSGQCLSLGSFRDSFDNACNMDVAEAFASLEPTEPGDVVALVPGASAPTVRKASQAYEAVLVGVVSTNPGLVFDNGKTYLAGDNSRLITANKTVVALVGRVPVKVSLENGPIAVGDPLTSAAQPGVAMKATRSGKIIGYAMEAADAPGKVLMLVQPGHYVSPADVAAQQERDAQIAALQSRVAELEARLAALERQAAGGTR